MIKLQTLAMAGSADQSAARPGSLGVLCQNFMCAVLCCAVLCCVVLYEVKS